MISGNTKVELIEQIQRERQEWESLLAEVGEERMEEPGAMGEWTFKDLVAHLTGWWQREVDRLEAIQDGRRPTTPWPAHLRDVDEINRWLYETNRNRSLADVLADASASWRRLEDGMQRFSNQELMEPGRYKEMDQDALGPGILRDFTSHFRDEHEPDVRHWLDHLNTRAAPRG
jgi:hypothetical protein